MSERELLTLISAIMALMALAIDLMLPALGDMRSSFGLAEDSNEVARVITMFFLGLAVAQVFYGPLTDRFGRKPVLYVSMGIYVAAAIASALAPTLELLLVARFAWGVGAAGSRVVATAIIRDRFEGNRMATAMSQVMAVFILVPVLAPTIGAGIIAVLPWRAIFWFCVGWTGFITLWSLRLPETLAPEHRRALQWRTISGGFGRVFRTRTTAGYTIATTFLQAVFTAYLASSELIISEIFGRGDQFPLVFGAVAVLFGLGALVNGRLVGVIGIRRLTHAVFALLVPGSLLLLTVTLAADGRPSFWLFMPIFALLLSLFMFLLPNLNTAALEPMGDIAGTASSLMGATRMAGGAVLGAVVDSQVSDTVTPFVVGFVLFSSLAAASTYLAEQ